MELSLTGQVALVTGASRGIGAAIAAELAGQGATVIGTATSAAGAEQIGKSLAAIQPDSYGLELNVADADSTAAALKSITERSGAVTVLVNNAGITRDQLLMRMSDDDWQDVLDTNLTGVYRITKACLRGMLKKRWGRIISVASVVGSSGNPGQTNYAATKAALGGFSRSLAQEVGSRGISVNVVAPGFIDTDMTRALSDEQRGGLAAKIPLGRLGEAKDIAAAVGWLASPAAAYVTGETLHVNGGMYMA